VDQTARAGVDVKIPSTFWQNLARKNCQHSGRIWRAKIVNILAEFVDQIARAGIDVKIPSTFWQNLARKNCQRFCAQN
jgi:hypothetical protein